MNVFIAIGDDRWCDGLESFGDTWIVGVFQSRELAEIANEDDRSRYVGPEKDHLGYYVIETELNKFNPQILN